MGSSYRVHSARRIDTPKAIWPWALHVTVKSIDMRKPRSPARGGLIL